jgi:hypothetical protein
VQETIEKIEELTEGAYGLASRGIGLVGKPPDSTATAGRDKRLLP